MAKNIVIGILLISNGSWLAFAFIQVQASEKQKLLTQEHKIEALRQAEVANEQRLIALEKETKILRCKEEIEMQKLLAEQYAEELAMQQEMSTNGNEPAKKRLTW